ncbi:hypothetical protein ACOSP7_025133 [Xanthoceras sorbifolium]
MNLSSSSPSSSSSGVSFSFDSKSAVSGCFAGILHRILCTRSHPTHPSDQIIESCSVSCDHKDQQLEETKQESVQDKVVAPSVVARLMGLESMSNMSAVGARTTPNSLTRSRSMNSLDCKGSVDQLRGGHRRVKSISTLSVLEMPAFLEQENEEFLVLSFENGSEETKRKSSSSRRKKSDTTSLPLKDSCEKQVCPGFENLECSTPIKNKEKSESETVKFRKKKCVENDCSSEDSSPVSVLDYYQFMTDHEIPRSELDSNLVESSSRRKLSPEPGGELANENRIGRNDSNLMISEDTKTKKNCLEMWDQIFKMTEAEIAGSKWWLYRENNNNILKKHEDIEQICADFELQIVDQSLDELVQQLVGLHMKL